MSDEKTEEPTDKKIEDARKKGQVPLSKDLARLATLVALSELALGTEGLWRGAIENLMELAVTSAGKPFMSSLTEMTAAAGTLFLLVVAITCVVGIVVGVTAHWGQFGILVAPEALAPSLDKLDPINGLKQLFSGKKLGELVITVGKAILIAIVIYIVVRQQLPTIILLSSGVPKDVYFGFLAVLRSILHIVGGLCLGLGIIDYAMQKHFHTKSLRMDFEEIKREYRESEGDPMIKGMRRQLARQWASQGAPAKTKNADAVVVNPTHFAIAMVYDTELAPVPVVLAKGKDEVAQAMIECARENGIPVIRHVWLARTLYATAKDDTVIPRSSYDAVAHVYAVVEELRQLDDMGREVELESLGDPPPSMQ